MTRSHRMMIFAAVFVACVSWAVAAQESSDKSGESTSQTTSQEYVFPLYGFAVTAHQIPNETGVSSGTQYLLYSDDDWLSVLNLTAERGPTDCAAWESWVESAFKHAGPKNAFQYPPADLHSSYPIAASGKIVNRNGSVAIEAEAPRNAMQAGYQLHQCLDGRLYHFEAGWKKDGAKPRVIDEIVSSFRLLAETTPPPAPTSAVDPVSGAWKLNVDKSTNPPVASELLTIVAQGTDFRLTFDITQDNEYNPHFEVVSDMKGETVKPTYAGGEGTTDTWRVTRKETNKFEMELIGPFGGWKDEYEVSADGKTLKCHRIPSKTGLVVTRRDRTGVAHIDQVIMIFERVQ